MNNSKEEFPYERFENAGAEALTDAELIAIILRTGTVGEDALTLAHKVLSIKSGSRSGLQALATISLEELMRIKGIGKVKAIRLKSVAEICLRMQRSNYLQKEVMFNNPVIVADYYMERMRQLETEHIYLLLTDTKNRLIKEILLSKGTVNASIISPREIFI